MPLPDVEAVVAKAMSQRYDVARARNDVSNAATNVEYLANQRLPDVRLETSYRGSGLGGAQLLRTGDVSRRGRRDAPTPASAACSARRSGPTTRRGASA